MSLMKKSAVVVALASAVSAQSTSSVINIVFPAVLDGDQAIVGSVVTSDASRTTLVAGCPASEECAIYEPVTLTVGPSTFRQSVESGDGLTLVLDCVLGGTTAATCGETLIGPEYVFGSVTGTEIPTSNTEITTSITTSILEASDISLATITLVDSLGTAAATTGASGTASTASSTGAGTRTSSGSSSASQTSSSSTASGSATASGSGNSGASRMDSRALAYSALGAGLLGLSVFLL